MREAPARQHFRMLIRQTDEHLSLAEVALCIAWEDTGVSQLQPTLQQLDTSAEQLRPEITDIGDPYRIIGILNSHLFGELGLQGNTWDYSDPHNSFLDQVFARQAGIPIALSVIYLEIGWRLGLPLSGVALPGHFLTRYHTEQEEIFIDPFHEGRLWSYSECEQQVQRAFGNVDTHIMNAVMRPPSKHDILRRMLRNLKNAYIRQNSLERALAASERLLLIAPNELIEVRDRGLIYLRLGHSYQALVDLERYMQKMPDATELAHLRETLRSLANTIARLN